MSASRTAAADRRAGSTATEGGSFASRAEVRDVLAWVRLLADPGDSAAVVRALGRPPIGLRQVDLARVIHLSRRRRLDLVSGLGPASESPRVPPEARERIQRFVELHRAASAELDTVPPERFIASLIELLGRRGRPLLDPDAAGERDASLEQLRELAARFTRLHPSASARELARHLAAELASGVRSRAEQQPEPDAPEQPAGDESHERLRGRLADAFQALREELLAGVESVGGGLGELRLDTDLDISHGIVRYLELLKLSALLQRHDDRGLADALEDVNERLLAAATPLQREIFLSSTLDESLLLAESGTLAGPIVPPTSEGRSFAPFLPRRGKGLALSASDIQTYRSCPLRYKFARILRIPLEQTISQRFGIVVHQVLERYHAGGGGSLERMLALLDAGWRRSGLGGDEECLGLHEKAVGALTLYHRRLAEEESEPVWFERQFSITLGDHHLRGRVDRVDRLAAGGEVAYELIDYKTSRPRNAEQLADDIQLSLYAIAARQAWQLDSSRQAYYYVLDDVKVPVRREEEGLGSVEEVVDAVGEGILTQSFEPTPSPAVCATCDYRIVCPASDA